MHGSNHNPRIGERVRFIDNDDQSHRAVVVDDVPDADYVTLVWGGDQGELGDEYHSQVETETSVYPHKHINEDGTSETHCFLPYHWSYDGEYDDPDEQA